MANELTLQNSAFSVSRTSAKGVVATRGIIGIISSGNKVERSSTAVGLMLHCWENGNFAPVISELRRVFNAEKYTTGAGFCGLNFMSPQKVEMLNWIRGIVSSFGDKAPKGEKALFVEAIKGIIRIETARLAHAKAMAAQAIENAQTEEVVA